MSHATTAPAAPDDATATAVAITAEALREHWQGHRRLTRRVIEAFPDEALFTYAVGGMRPFAELAQELLHTAVPIARGVATGEWVQVDDPTPATRAELLARWDEATAELDRWWAQIPPHRFQEPDAAFGQWEMPGYGAILYGVENEVHHRGQGYVYLRALGVEPPPFYDRG